MEIVYILHINVLIIIFFSLTFTASYSYRLFYYTFFFKFKFYKYLNYKEILSEIIVRNLTSKKYIYQEKFKLLIIVHIRLY